jgi:hypothetical protein
VKEGSKRFFFEKKKQKTFGTLGCAAGPRGGPILLRHCERSEAIQVRPHLPLNLDCFAGARNDEWIAA